MTSEGLYVETWHVESGDRCVDRLLVKASRVRITRVAADGTPGVAYIAWDGLDA